MDGAADHRLGILVLLFGAKKSPSWRGAAAVPCRIFKAETKGLLEDDDKDATPEQREIDERNRGRLRARARGPEQPTWKTPTRPAPSLTTGPAAVSVGGVIELFRGRPRDPHRRGRPDVPRRPLPGARARVMRISLYLVVGTIIALFFYDQLFRLIFDPYNDARRMLGQGTQTQAVITGVGGPLLLQLKLCSIAGYRRHQPVGGSREI